jgi:uncharacterized protein YjbJ (UPF0337 family)
MSSPTTPSDPTTPVTTEAAAADVHSALDGVEEKFKNLYGKVSAEVKKLLGHLHSQADGLATDAEADVKEDMAEAKDDVQTVTVTGQSALGGGVNPNAVTPTTPAPNIPVQQEAQQTLPPTQIP